MGLARNMAPRLVSSVDNEKTDRTKVCTEIYKAAWDNRNNAKGNSAAFVRNAIFKARNEATKMVIESTWNHGSFLEARGWLKSNVKVTDAQVGDIVIFESSEERERGHIAIKCPTGPNSPAGSDGWVSDYL